VLAQRVPGASGIATQKGGDMKLETLIVHGGYSPDPTTRAVAVPIYHTVAYAFDDTQHGADLFDLKSPAISTPAS
jgi:O-acetylhomoserine/O-acetylserine sulfhydrylase-like pyridoxal-dependent enzyme